MQYSEKDIEKMIMDDIDIIDPDLYIIGNQISLGGYGVLDILAFNPIKREYVVIELKSEIVTEKAITQIMRYMQAVKDFIEECGHKFGVSGILAAPEIDNDATSALRYIQDKVQFYQLSLNIQSESTNYVRINDSPEFKSDLAKFNAIIDEFEPEELIKEYTEEGEEDGEA